MQSFNVVPYIVIRNGIDFVKILFNILFLNAWANFSFSQVVYFEDFGVGCTTGTLATAFGWTNTNVTANQATPNIWYVSANERGVGPGNCGIGCGGTENRTLHVGADAVAGGDGGAAYLESSAFICTLLGWCSKTDKRIESPTINCTGISSIPLTFDYIENGEGLNDNATVWYSANNGTTWTLLDDCPKTVLCVSGQGLWTTRNLTLPASADNNATVKIAFRWVNNANGTGTDPSFAVDNIQVGTPVILDVEMVDMHVNCEANATTISWTTKSEFNADYFSVYKSADGVDWKLLSSVSATNSSSENNYSVRDEKTANQQYYYIEQVDRDGKRKSYSIMSSEDCFPKNEISIYPNPSNGAEITVTSNKNILSLELISVDGQVIERYINDREKNVIHFFPNVNAGTYFIKIISDNEIQMRTLVISN